MSERIHHRGFARFQAFSEAVRDDLKLEWHEDSSEFSINYRVT